MKNLQEFRRENRLTSQLRVYLMDMHRFHQVTMSHNAFVKTRLSAVCPVFKYAVLQTRLVWRTTGSIDRYSQVLPSYIA